MKTNKTKTQMTTMVDGLMTFGATDNGLHTLDFANCKVQGMRDGNVYITERPKQKHNTPIFREDNSTLTLGRDGKYYFCFILPEAKVKRLPDALVHQALSIAQKVERTILKRKGHKGLIGKK